MLDVDGATGKSGVEVDFCGVYEVVATAFESGMILLLDLERNVAGFNARVLITLALEIDLVAIWDATVDGNVEHFALNNSLLALALAAPILIANGFTFALAVGADGLETLNHGAHLAHHRLHSRTLAALASLDSPSFAASTLAFGAQDRLLKGKFGDFAIIDVLQGNLVHMVDGSGLLGAGVTRASTKHAAEAATTEELREQVFGIHATHSATLFGQALFAILVVYCALLRVRQNLVRSRNLFELVRSLSIARILICRPVRLERRALYDDHTRMILEGALLVGCLQLGVCGIWGNLEYPISFILADSRVALTPSNS